MTAAHPSPSSEGSSNGLLWLWVLGTLAVLGLAWVLIPSNSLTPVSVAASPGLVFEGVVRDLSGDPVPGLLVAAAPYDVTGALVAGTVRADAEGRFHLALPWPATLGAWRHVAVDLPDGPDREAQLAAVFEQLGDGTLSPDVRCGWSELRANVLSSEAGAPFHLTVVTDLVVNEPPGEGVRVFGELAGIEADGSVRHSISLHCGGGSVSVIADPDGRFDLGWMPAVRYASWSVRPLGAQGLAPYSGRLDLSAHDGSALRLELRDALGPRSDSR